MTATPYPAESFGMQQIQRRYGASAARLANATRHQLGHDPVPVYVNLEPEEVSDWVRILADLVRLAPADWAAQFLEDSHAAVREAAMFAVCAEVTK